MPPGASGWRRWWRRRAAPTKSRCPEPSGVHAVVIASPCATPPQSRGMCEGPALCRLPVNCQLSVATFAAAALPLSQTPRHPRPYTRHAYLDWMHLWGPPQFTPPEASRTRMPPGASAAWTLTRAQAKVRHHTMLSFT